MNGDEADFRSAFVAVVGRPNVGKSTLVNALVGDKVAITAPTPQTTRHRIAGVVDTPGCQLVVLDLPGFQRPRDLLTRRMQQAADTTLAEVDMILLVVNAAERIGEGDKFVARSAFSTGTHVIIVVNKIDLLSREALLPQVQAAGELGEFADLFPVSATCGDGIDELKQAIASRALPGPRFFPAGTRTDQPEQVLVSELIREQVLRLTSEEVPHSVAVELQFMEQGEGGGIVDIGAVIIVERKSQKGILIGKQGRMIKKIGSRARREIEALLGSKVFLDLVVKVRKKWRDDERVLGDLGL